MIYSADGAAVIDAHLTDENAHKDEFAKYLPLSGGEMTGDISFDNDNANRRFSAEYNAYQLIIGLRNKNNAQYRTQTTFGTGGIILEGGSPNGSAQMSVSGGKVCLNSDNGVEIDKVVTPTTDTMPTPKSYVDAAVDAKAPAYTYGTSDLTAGKSSLETGKLYFVYE